jgi:hypothetical protein
MSETSLDLANAALAVKRSERDKILANWATEAARVFNAVVNGDSRAPGTLAGPPSNEAAYHSALERVNREILSLKAAVGGLGGPAFDGTSA